MVDSVAALPRLDLSEDQAAAVRHGRQLAASTEHPNGTLVALVRADSLCAVYRVESDRLVPDRVLLSPNQSIFTEGPNVESYRFVFTGQLPDSYLQESANRAMISDAARQVPQALVNSSINALAAMMLNLILGAPAAFVFARYIFPGKKVSFLYLILSPLVPAVALVTPIYMMMQWLGLVGSPLGIILVHTARALPFTVLILSVFFRKMPAELFDLPLVSFR